MKALIIGDGNSIFVKQYIETVFSRDDVVVLIVENKLEEEYQKFYISRNIQLEPISTVSSIIQRIPVVRSVVGSRLWSRYIIRKYERFDLVHIHAVYRPHQIISKCMRPRTDLLVVTVWGDELLRRNKKQLEGLGKSYDIADRITLATDGMIAKFRLVYGNKYDDKIFKCPFGLGIIDLMDYYRSVSREDLCRYVGIADSRKINVFVGHNGRETQRHIEITRLLSQLPVSVKSEINLVFTMTYGNTAQEYLDELKSVIKEYGYSYTYLTGYKTEEYIAKLRLSCDILIHAQLTDAASASIRESMYAGAIIINGSWLPYNNIPDYHKRVIEYDAMSELPGIIETIVSNYNERKTFYETCNKENRDGLISTVAVTENWKKAICK